MTLEKHCRIGRVKMKNGGAALTILPENKEGRYRELFRTATIESHKEKAICAGYFIKCRDGSMIANFANGKGVFVADLAGGAVNLQQSIYNYFRDNE